VVLLNDREEDLYLSAHAYVCAVTEAGQRDAEQELAAMAEVLTEEPEPLTNQMHGETGVSLLAGVVSLSAACDSPMTDAENSPGRRAPGSSAKRPLVSAFPSYVSHLYLSVCCNAVMHASICVIVCQSCHVMCQIFTCGRWGLIRALARLQGESAEPLRAPLAQLSVASPTRRTRSSSNGIKGEQRTAEHQ
jgi:hypothetical protein